MFIEKNIGCNGILEGLKIAEGEILSWTHADIKLIQRFNKGLKVFDVKTKNVCKRITLWKTY